MFVTIITTILFLSSCGSNINHSSVSSSSESSIASSVLPTPISLEEAIMNTEYYNLFFSINEGSGYYKKNYVEIYSPTDYCYVNENIGHIVLDSDPEFTHQYSITIGDDGMELTMYGRIEDKNYVTTYSSGVTKLIDYLKEYSSLFTVSDDNPWLYQYYGSDISDTLKNFFQLHGFSYCNYYELRIGYDGRLAQFNAGESYNNSHDDIILTNEFSFEEGGLKRTYLYDEWVNNNQKIDLRIIDLKSMYSKNFRYYPCYSEASIEAIVTSVDYDDSFFISIEDKLTGPIGMKVIPSSNTYIPKVNDVVNVSGKIKVQTEYSKKDAFSPYFYDAEVKKVSTSFYCPIFSEEALVDKNGAGIYASYLLGKHPMYSGSLYTGYGYAYDIPSSINYEEDTLINIICPSFVADNIGNPFMMKLIIPSALGETKINEIYEEIKLLGDYKVDSENAKMVSMTNCIFYFDFAASRNGQIGGMVYITSSSIVSHRYSFDEMLLNEYGISNFPTMINDTIATFHFGHSSQFYLEYLYGSSDKEASGLFYQVDCTPSEVNNYLNSISSMDGMIFIDGFQYSFSVRYQHYIFKYNDIYIDIIPIIDTTCTVYTFIYRNEHVVRSKTIQEKIDEKCASFFNSEDFIKLSGTYDYNYRFYSLSSYAGHKFDDNNKLSVATMELMEDRYKELRDAYRAIGYKQYREDNNDPYSKVYSYITRGVSHVVYYKTNENGKYTFLDFAQYPTTDYTFSGHDSFKYRVEILIYEGEKPLETKYTNNMNEFVASCTSSYFDWTLPDEYKAEIYYQQEGDAATRFYDYGYTFNTDAFIYPNSISELDNCYKYVISVFESHGFTFSFNGNKGVCYSYIDEVTKYGEFVYIMKDDRGFVRIINSIGGIDF